MAKDEATCTVADCQEWIDTGYYAKAATGLQSIFTRDKGDATVVLILAETFLSQGYYTKCLDTLREFLREMGNVTFAWKPALVMLHNLASAVVTGNFHNSLLSAEAIYKEVFSSDEVINFDEVKVLVEQYHCVLLHQAMSFRLVRQEVIASIPNRRLRPIFDFLIKSDRFEEALRIATTYRYSPITTDSGALLVAVTDHMKVPRRIKTRAMMLLVELHENDEDPSICDQYSDLVRLTLRDEQHAFFLLDIDVSQACRKVSSSFEATINNCLLQYESLDYPSGSQRALLKVRSRAQRLYNYPVVEETSKALEKLAKRTSTQLLWTLSFISTLNFWFLRSGHDGKVISAARAMYESLQGSDCVFIRGQVAEMLSVAYYRLRNGEQALSWARKAEEAYEGSPPADRSRASRAALNAKLLCLRGSNNKRDMIKLVKSLVQKDIENNLVEEAVQKVDALSTFVLESTSSDDAGINDFNSLTSQIKEPIATLPERESRLRMANFLHNSVLPLVRESMSRKDFEKELEACAVLEEAFKLYHQDSELFHAAIIRLQQGTLGQSILTKMGNNGDFRVEKALEVWRQSLRYFAVSKETFVAMNQVQQAAEATYWEAFMYYEAWVRQWETGEVVLQKFRDAEKGYDRLREELSTLGGLDAISNKRQLSSSKHVRDIYRFAIQICFTERRNLELWAWIQKGKARSLSDLLGLGILAPKTLMDRISGDEFARSQIEEEISLSNRLAVAPALDQFDLKISLEKLRQQMKEHSSLKELINLREGSSVSLGELQEQLTVNNRRLAVGELILVDWVFKFDDIWMLVVRASSDPVMEVLPISAGTVKLWVQRYLSSKLGYEKSIKMDDRDPENQLRELDGLMAPLRHLSKPEDFLVFSPSDVLHSLPLHALHLEQNLPVIERNPVVYSASLTTFIQCCTRVTRSPASEHISKTMLAVLEPNRPGHTDYQELEEQRNVYESAKKLAESFQFEKAICGGDVDHVAVSRVLEDSDIVIFHGHCDQSKDEKDAMMQGLRIMNQKGNLDQFTVREFFNSRLRASHISLLACASASQAITAGEEPLGIVTALLCAGAASVLGTIWPVQSATARAFTKLFLSKFVEVRCGNMLNLALAAREAVLDLRDDMAMRTVYDWGAFVFHGSLFWKEHDEDEQ